MSNVIEQIESQIAKLSTKVARKNTGIIRTIADGVAKIEGLSDVMYNEMVSFPGGVIGIALNLEEDEVGCVILGDVSQLKQGDEVATTGKLLSIPVGKALLGRVVDALGRPVDGKGPIDSKETYPVEKIAPGIIVRKSVSQPLFTGIMAIDSMIPIGRGQRELIIGDRGTGKTAIALDAIINQRSSDVICVYAAIGQKASSVAQVIDAIRRYGAPERCLFVVGEADAAPGLQWLTPYAACT
ncbi:MAG: F0F1 ATP synthase subunit alpha, partial [Oleiharenicola lentus]